MAPVLRSPSADVGQRRRGLRRLTELPHSAPGSRQLSAVARRRRAQYHLARLGSHRRHRARRPRRGPGRGTRHGGAATPRAGAAGSGTARRAGAPESRPGGARRPVGSRGAAAESGQRDPVGGVTKGSSVVRRVPATPGWRALAPLAWSSHAVFVSWRRRPVLKRTTSSQRPQTRPLRPPAGVPFNDGPTPHGRRPATAGLAQVRSLLPD
jgi:hypothetical protein